MFANDSLQLSVARHWITIHCYRTEALAQLPLQFGRQGVRIFHGIELDQA